YSQPCSRPGELAGEPAGAASEDGSDRCRRMVRALIRYLRGEPEACSVVRVPSVEQEDAKRLHRERRRLIAERVQHVNRIKGLCATQGIYDYSPLRKDRLTRLDDLHTGDGRVLPTRLKAEIVRELKRLELVLEMIATVETERDAILTNPASTHLNAGKIKMLAKLRAIGPGVRHHSRWRGVLSRICQSSKIG